MVNASKVFDELFSLGNKMVLANVFCPQLLPLLHFLGYRLVNQNIMDFFTDVTNQTMDMRKDDKCGKVDFITLMMNAHNEDENKGSKALTRTEILAQAILFFTAGYDTTASSISFLAYNLACHPEEQDKLIEEVKDVIGDKDDITDEDLHKMPYLEMCMNESLRMYSIVLRLERYAARDVVVKGIPLPKGSMVGYPIYQIHHSPEIYPEPEKFKPER